MQAKLTLSLDKEIIEQAKKFARKRQNSLSKMVENYLRDVTGTTPPGDEKITPLVAELSGVIPPAAAERRKEEYADFLEEKYR